MLHLTTCVQTTASHDCFLPNINQPCGVGSSSASLFSKRLGDRRRSFDVWPHDKDNNRSRRQQCHKDLWRKAVFVIALKLTGARHEQSCGWILKCRDDELSPTDAGEKFLNRGVCHTGSCVPHGLPATASTKHSCERVAVVGHLTGALVAASVSEQIDGE